MDKTNKPSKISTKAFTFSNFDGTKDAPTVFAWLNHLDEYFMDENYSEKEKIKCAGNHLIKGVAMWWHVNKLNGKKPKTWAHFQKLIKQNFCLLLIKTTLNPNGKNFVNFHMKMFIRTLNVFGKFFWNSKPLKN